MIYKYLNILNFMYVIFNSVTIHFLISQYLEALAYNLSLVKP